jgi:hypothetical protein
MNEIKRPLNTSLCDNVNFIIVNCIQYKPLNVIILNVIIKFFKIFKAHVIFLQVHKQLVPLVNVIVRLL